MVDLIQYLAKFRHDWFVMFKNPDFLYLTNFSRIEKGES